MRSSDKTYTIMEYGGFTRGVDLCGFQGLPERTFDALEAFILANNTGTVTEVVELLSLSARRGAGKIITARNYVGLITMTDGTVIEILPKIAGGDLSENDTKKIFLEMLKALKDVSFKNFNVSSLRTERLILLEIFIKMFIDEVTILTKQGLKSSYMPVEANERFYKGKLLACQNIKYNLVSSERIFVRYDDFSINRPENRLIKTTLRFLLKATGDGGNRRNIMRLLSFFDGVGYSKSVDTDFSKSIVDRSMNHYEKAISWCRAFLKGNSFTAFSGNSVALALLFPMEKVFESFISTKFRQRIGNDVNLRIQDARYSLFDRPSRAFSLRPDLVLEFDGNTVILDTKWKLLSDNTRNSGISQSDMYQMYAYSKKYDAKWIFLLYPHSDAVSSTDIRYVSDDNVNVQVFFIDLRNVDDSISKLLSVVFS
ncbi:McrC family protein [Acetobacterium malicum]|uniref:McrC family protein n=1 Tax=Acetobacterium malicum TaxID=52692 RepID=UPI0035940DD7